MRALSINPTLSQILAVLILIIFSFFLIACPGDEDEPSLEGSEYSISDITGNWTATLALFSSLDPDLIATVDIIDEGGTLKLVVQSNGNFTITITLPGEPLQVIKGKFGFEEEYLTVSYEDDPGEYDYFFIDMNDAKTQLTIRGDGTYDFDDDGDEEMSSINLELVKD